MLTALGIVPGRISDTDVDRFLGGGDHELLLRHCAWICIAIPQVIERPSGQNLCLRWIGSVEGVLIAYGLLTVEQVRKQFRKSMVIRQLERELNELPRE